MCEIIQPCTTQCIALTIRKAKISCKTSMFKPSAQDVLTPFGTLQLYTTLFDSFTDFSFHFYTTLNFFSIMVRLTDVQRGRAIALLMQGQSQQQVCLFVLRFYGPVNPMGSYRARSVYLTTRLLGRLSPLSG